MTSLVLLLICTQVCMIYDIYAMTSLVLLCLYVPTCPIRLYTHVPYRLIYTHVPYRLKYTYIV